MILKLRKMDKKRISKFLSLILRHKPEALGITLNDEGWASTQEIIEKMNKKGMKVNLDLIREVVRENNKQRFKLSEDALHIRANQGHSININLGLTPVEPPATLFHGTALKNKASILFKGIIKGTRQHVHLSADLETAIKVGQRHGQPLVFTINTQQMFEDGIDFYQAENGVWLTAFVHPKYMKS